MNRIGPYVLEGKLGSGAAGSVYRARDTELDRPVAIKLLAEGLGPEDFARCRREARLTARVRHPHVVGVHGAGRTAAGEAYLVLDLVEGGSLKDRLHGEGTLPPREAAALARDLADALHAAHAQGVLHRDVKPENVLLDSAGRALLADFGVARGLTVSGLTQTGDLIGTPAYMSPEQALAQHEKVGPGTDIYGLGATLYAMLCGEPPFVRQDVPSCLEAIAYEPVQPIGTRVTGLDEGLAAICMRCLARTPRDRFPSAAALRTALEEHLRGPRSPARGALPGRRGEWLARGAAAALGLGLGLLAWALASASGEERPFTGELLDLRRRSVERAGRGDHAGALADLDLLVAERPDSVVVWYDRSEAKLNLANPSGSLADLDRAQQLPVSDPEVLHYARGKAYIQQHDWAAALRALDRTLELRPHYAIALLQRGLAKEHLGDVEGARLDYRTALEQDPRMAHANLRLGGLAMLEDDHPTAEREFNACLAVNPQLTTALAQRARIRLAAEDLPGALADCEAAMQPLVVQAVEPWLTRVEVLLRQDRWREARAGCDLVLWADPEATDGYMLRSTVHRGLGQLAESEGRTERAAEHFRAALADNTAYAARKTDAETLRLAAEVEAGLHALLRRLRPR